MQVAEVLLLEKYGSDPRFDAKKPVINGTAHQRYGDNIYYKDAVGEWKQRPSYHRKKEMEHDLSGVNVLVAQHFYYFGNNAEEIPSKYGGIIPKGRGHRCNFSPDIVANFLNWLQTSFEPGIHGEPWEQSQREQHMREKLFTVSKPQMQPISIFKNIRIPKDTVAEFCRRHHIRKLSLFGSILRKDFRPDSDIDVLVEFETGYAVGLIRLAGIESELSKLLGRKVDMRTPADLSRYFRQEVLDSAEVQYAQ